jgi:hypothetical protein
MSTVQRAALLGVLAFTAVLASPAPLASQEAVAQARPALTDEQMANFLLTAKIVSTKGVNTGVTNTQRATLTDGQITHDASIQTVDISKSVFTPDTGKTQLNFKDTYRYNIAGYRLAKMLGLDSVPMSVDRRVRGTHASMTWWIDDVVMDEGQRVKKQPPSVPLPPKTAGQIHIMRVFDELISNTDRNAGNLLWTSDGKMWMIDHTRAFRFNTKLNNPKLLERIDRNLLTGMRRLTAENLKEAMGDSLIKSEIEPLLARRDEIINLFEAKIKERGEGAILYTLER